MTGEALAFSAALRLARPAVGVILARKEVDITLLTQALQSGVREVVPAGDHAALAAACRRSYEISRRMLAPVPQDEPTPGQIVTVFAAKGGCGKTTLAINLGVALARQGRPRVRRGPRPRRSATSRSASSLTPLRTVVDALPMAGHLDVAGAASLLTRYQPGLDVLLAPVTPGDAEKIPPRLVGELLAVLRTMFDFVVVDTPAAVQRARADRDGRLVPARAAHHAGRARAEEPSRHAGHARPAVLPEADPLGGGQPLGLQGRAEPRARGAGRAVPDLRAYIPSSRAVPISINKGVPITLDSPGHPVSQAVMQVRPAAAARPARGTQEASGQVTAVRGGLHEPVRPALPDAGGWRAPAGTARCAPPRCPPR